MFIQNPVWKSVPASLLEAPVWEGTVLSENGEIIWAPSDSGGHDSTMQIQAVGPILPGDPIGPVVNSIIANEPYGIVPETIYVLPPTMMINVAVGGTIDLTLPGNEAMENFPEDVADELGADFNFVRHNEHTGGSGGPVYSSVLARTTKSVSNEWVTSFSGGPILEGVNYRVIVNGTTYEPLVGTAGEVGYICLGNTYVDDSEPSGDYPFGIFYKDNQLSAWLETGDSMTMQIDQIIHPVPVPSPTVPDTGNVLTANNGAVEWKPSVTVFDTTISGSVYTFNSTWQEVYDRFMTGLAYVRIENDICQILAVRDYAEGNSYEILVTVNFGLVSLGTDTPTGYPSIDLD